MVGFRNREKKWNVFFAFICVLLFVFLAGMLVLGKKTEKEEQDRLKELAKKKQQPVQEELQKNETTDFLEGELPEENGNPEGVVCWGDEFLGGEEALNYSYKSVLQRILRENGYSLSVQDKTLEGAGTLSMMTMAGVPGEQVQQFVGKHQIAAAGAELGVTETEIRELTPEQMARTDVNCIPIIFMGYYGGWNHDPVELAEQQQKILDTFSNQERFLIIGTAPFDGSVDVAGMDTVLRERWREHYISTAEVCSAPISTYEAQEQLAQVIFHKLVEFNYIQREG